MPTDEVSGHSLPGRYAAANVPKVSVIVPHYNDLSALDRCLAGLRRQVWPPEQLEIIVADNNSACGLTAVRAVAGRFLVVHAPIQGAGPARNAGAAVASGEILAFIDSDCEPCEGWVAEGVRALVDSDFAGGHVANIPRDKQAITAVEAWEMEFGFNFERYILREGYTGSGNMWVWRRVFDAVGGFRAGVSEDMDWSFRARAAGFRLSYAPDAAVKHYARRDWQELRARWRRVIREHYLLARERPFGRLRWSARTIAMPLSIAPHLVRIARSDRLPDLRSRTAAAAILIAHRLWRAGEMMRMALAPVS